MRFTIPGELPDLNTIIAESKAHWGSYSSLKRAETERVAWLAKELRRLRSKPVQRALLRITWYCPNRRKDPDNIEAGAKFVLDGLVKAGILQNDGWKQIAGIEHEFRVDPDNPRVEVEIIPLEEVG